MVATQAIDQTAVEALASFPLLDALFGRRARRFGLGMTIAGGPLAHTSARPPLPLSEVERTLLILCGVGISGLITPRTGTIF
jgi:hypothetical protein